MECWLLGSVPCGVVVQQLDELTQDPARADVSVQLVVRMCAVTRLYGCVWHKAGHRQRWH
jgi:hypothetical protein